MSANDFSICHFCVDENLQNVIMLHHIHVSKESKLSAIISCIEDQLEANNSLVLLFAIDKHKNAQIKVDPIPENREDVNKVSENTVTNTKSNFLPINMLQEYMIPNAASNFQTDGVETNDHKYFEDGGNICFRPLFLYFSECL